MAINDLYELTYVQRLNEQAVYNVFHYQQSDSTVGQTITSAEALCNAFEQDVMPQILALQTSDVSAVELRAKNLFSAADNHVMSVTGSGDITSFVSGSTDDCLPSFVQIPLILIQGNGEVKNGAKRIAGVSEGVQTDGVITLPAMLTQLEGAAGVLAGAIWDGDITHPSFDPVVIKRVKEVSGEQTTYRLPENIGEAVFGLVIDVLWDVLLSHQISRGIGFGI